MSLRPLCGLTLALEFFYSPSKWTEGTPSADQRIDRVSHSERKAYSQRVRKDKEDRRDHRWTDYSKCVEVRMARDHWSISLLSRQTISKISRTDSFSWGVLSWTSVFASLSHLTSTRGAMFCFCCLSESLPLYNNLARFRVSETRLSYHELMKSSGCPFSSQTSGPTPMAMKWRPAVPLLAFTGCWWQRKGPSLIKSLNLLLSNYLVHHQPLPWRE